MGFLPAIVEITDENGVRVDRPDVAGNQAPVRLVLGSNLQGTASTNGGLTEVRLDASGGGESVALADHDAFRAIALVDLTNNEIFHFTSPPGTFVYDTSRGAGIADDDQNVLRNTNVLLGQNGRAFNVNTSAILPTIAALRLATWSTQKAIQVSNYSTINDGGGGTFVLVEDDITSADDGGLIIVAGSLRWKRQYNGLVDPRWFGAKADDGVALTDVACTSGSAIVTSASAAFVAEDAGKIWAQECAWSPATGTVSTVSASAATGTFTAVALSPFIIGAGTAFLTELFVGMQLRCAGAWGAGVTVTVIKITDDTHATVNFRASFSAGGLTLLRYYMTGAGTSFTTELTEGQGVIISGTQYWIGPIASNTRCGLLKSMSGGTVVSASASGLTMYRKTVFEANILSVQDAHSITLDANVPRTLSGMAAFYATNSHAAWVAAIATLPTALHLVGEQCIKGTALDPGDWPLTIQGEGWSQLSGQNGFMSPSLSCTHPVDGSVLRVFGGADGVVTSATSYRKLQLHHAALVGTGVLGSKGLYPTAGDPGANSNENIFDNVCVFNFEDGFRLFNTLETKAFIPFSAMSCLNGLNVYDAVTNSHIAVKAEGNYRGVLVRSGTGITFKGTVQDNFYGIALAPAIAGLDEIIWKETHVEGNQDSWLIDCTSFGVSRLMIGDGFHDFSENSFFVRTTGFAILAKLDIGGASKVPYYWIAPAFNNRWNLTGDGYLAIEAGAAAIKLSDFNGVYETAGIGQTLVNVAGVVSPDWTLGNPKSITLTANITEVALPTNAPIGAYVAFKFKQDGTGERTVAFNAGYKGDIRIDPLGQRVTSIVFYQETAGVWQKVYGTGNSCNLIRTGNDGSWISHNSDGTESTIVQVGGDRAVQFGSTGADGVSVAMKARSGYTLVIDSVSVHHEAAGFGEFFKVHYYEQNALGAATTEMVEITNQTAGANGAQQWSPALALVGSGYHSGGTPGASECRWQMFCVPVQSSGSLPDMELRFKGLIGSTIGTSPIVLRLDGDGTLKVGLWGHAAVAQQQITDSTGAVATTAVIDVTSAGLADPAKVNANFASLVAALQASGILKN